MEVRGDLPLFPVVIKRFPFISYRSFSVCHGPPLQQLTTYPPHSSDSVSTRGVLSKGRNKVSRQRLLVSYVIINDNKHRKEHQVSVYW